MAVAFPTVLGKVVHKHLIAVESFLFSSIILEEVMFSPKCIGAMCLVLWFFLHPVVGANDPLPQMNQHQARADALRRAKMASRMQNMDIEYIKQRWHTKAATLRQLVQSAKERQLKVDLLASKRRETGHFAALSKTRALSETHTNEQFLRERRKAENRAIAALTKQLEKIDPNFRDNALRQAKQSIEIHPGLMEKNLVNLPELEGALPMAYPQYLPPNPNQLFGNVQYAKTANKTGVATAVGKLARNETVRRLSTQTKNFHQAGLRTVRKHEALQRVVTVANKVHEARKKEAAKSKDQRLKELLELYLSDKITAGDYYKQRAIIRADQ